MGQSANQGMSESAMCALPVESLVGAVSSMMRSRVKRDGLIFVMEATPILTPIYAYLVALAGELSPSCQGSVVAVATRPV
jgi:hypothetical protein